MVEQLITDVLLPIIATIATAAVPILIKFGVDYLKAKTSNEKVHSALNQLNDLVVTTVKELEQTTRAALSDGKLTQEEKDKIKAIAMTKIKGQVPKYLGDQLQVAVTDLSEYISSKIEAAVNEINASKPKVS